jgi:RNA polymerase sigma factor (sigma-70 family)
LSHGPSATETRHLRTLFAVGAAGTLTDGQLLERFATRDGDPAELAFAALVERHGSMVLRVARGVALDEHSAHDAFQATFLILARKARSLWVRDSLGPWLHSVAFRVASHSRSMELRRKRREKDASKPEADHSQIADRADLIRAIHEEIDRLPQPFRLAVVTCHLEGLTQHDAAERLGWPVGTLQSRLARGRQKLRDRLERRGLNPSLAVIAYQCSAVPHLLTTTTARAAASLNLGKAITGMIAPTVLAMIETSTKGMLMTKLKIGATAVVMMIGGVIGSGMAVGVGRPVQATDEPPAIVGSTNEPAPAKKDAKRLAVPRAADPAPDFDAIPAPVKGLRSAVLLDFEDTRSEVSIEMRPVVARLVEAGYPIKTIDIKRSPNLVGRYQVHSFPEFILVDGSGTVLGQRLGCVHSSDLARFYNQTLADAAEERPVETEPARPLLADLPLDGDPQQQSEPEPSLTDPTSPKPWATVVRIKLKLSEKEWGFGSGTVISSTDLESIILTCAHTFRLKGQPQPAPKDFKVPITVDLFDGQLVGQSPAMVGRAEQDVVGQAIDFDFNNNVALIRIRPGRKLPSSRVVPFGWEPTRGMKMIAVGCSHGNDATAWDTTILDPRVTMSNSATKKTFSEIKCDHQPKGGRSGGGLFTTNGLVAGVCNFADPNEHVGLYAVPDAIHRLFDRNGLSSLYEKGDGNPRTADVDIHGFKYPAPADMLAAAGHQLPAPGAADDDPPANPPQPNDEQKALKKLAPTGDGSQGFPLLLFFLDSQAFREPPSNEVIKLLRVGFPIKLIDVIASPELVKKYGIMAQPTIVLVDPKGSRIAESKEDSSALQVARFYNLHWANPFLRSKLYKPTPEDRRVYSLPPEDAKPTLANPPTDDKRRIDELEKKLDQVLKALEGLKGEKKPE